MPENLPCTASGGGNDKNAAGGGAATKLKECAHATHGSNRESLVNNKIFVTVAAAVIGLTMTLVVFGQENEQQRTLCQRVKPVELPPGAPDRSSVLLRSIVEHPRNEHDPHDTTRAIRQFHATHLIWVYGNDRDFIKRVHELGLNYQGALAHASYAGERDEDDWKRQVAALNLDGDYVTAPWMRTWKPRRWWGCANNPRYRQGHLEAAVRAVEAGADFLQRDEPGGNHISVKWGACFCEHCMRGFREYLARTLSVEKLRHMGIEDIQTFNYAEYLRTRNAPVGDDYWSKHTDPLKQHFEDFQFETMVEFHQWWRRELNKRAGRYVPVACNNGTHRWSEIEAQFDVFNGELNYSRARPGQLYDAIRKATEMDKFQVVSMPQKGNRENMNPWEQRIRQSTATAYAAGGIGRVPWDTYMPNNAPRFFGAPEKYADLFGFVRACAALIDDYEDVFAAGGNVHDTRWEDEMPPVTMTGGTGEVYAFVRAKPKEPRAPIVIHLVEWADEPQPFQITIEPAAFFSGRPVRWRLMTPAPHDARHHRRAWETKDYERLREVTELAQGPVGTLELPALSPWGILVIDPAPDASGGVWPPTARKSRKFYQPIDVTLETATAGAEIRYTLDGTPPSRSARLYTEPFRVAETTRVRVRAFAHGQASVETSVELVRRQPPPDLARNGDFAKRLEHWQSAARGAAEGGMEVSTAVDNPLSENRACKIVLTKADGVVYHLRLMQRFEAKQDCHYTLRFRAMADQPTRFRPGLQAASSPSHCIAIRRTALPDEPTEFVISGKNRYGNREFLIQFDVGTAGIGRTIWIDDVELIEESP